MCRRAVARCQGKNPGASWVPGPMLRPAPWRAPGNCRGLGVDGVMLVTPYYNKPPQEGLYRHFVAAADASAVPVSAVQRAGPYRGRFAAGTVRGSQPDPANRCASRKHSGSVERGRECLAACPAGLAAVRRRCHGDRTDAHGTQGVISVTANVAPRRMREACAAALRGDMARRARIDATLQPLHRDLFIEANPIPVKWAMAQLGLIGARMRLPLVELAPAYHETVRRALQRGRHRLKDQAA